MKFPPAMAKAIELCERENTNMRELLPMLVRGSHCPECLAKHLIIVARAILEDFEEECEALITHMQIVNDRHMRNCLHDQALGELIKDCGIKA